MKYENSVNIKGDLNTIAELYQDENQFSKWQEGFQSLELIEGEKGKAGAKTIYRYMMKNRSMELTETIISNNLPSEKKALYEHSHMDNNLTVNFKDLGNGEVELKTEVDYFKIKHWMPRLMSKLFPNMFKKQSQKWLDNFKLLAESKL